MSLVLRPYQNHTVDLLWDYLRNQKGNPVLCLPTGSGKSVIIAEICKQALQNWPGTRILMVTHQAELIQQNLDKLRSHWPNAPVGVYSASLGRREIGEPILFAGIQSIRNRVEEIGHIDMILCDESHLISHEETGSYRWVIGGLKDINPKIRVVGLTASPFRLGHGLITEGEALFDDIIEPVSIIQLQAFGYLADLRSKVTKLHLITDGVTKRGGDYVESELQKAVDTDYQNESAVDQTITLAGDRRSWLFFCTGVKHAEHIKDVLISRGITAECVTGDTPKDERARILKEFKEGKIKALTNANVLTTGFDAPNVDLIAMMRPTCSPGLYMQIAGRGLRLKEHTDHCLVLDYAGVVEMHGPITSIKVQDYKKKDKEKGVPPSKLCPECDEIVAMSARTCPSCGYIFPKKEKEEMRLHDNDIMGRDLEMEMAVHSWEWFFRKVKSGKEALVCKYNPVSISSDPILQFFNINHDNQWVVNLSHKEIDGIMMACGVTEKDTDVLNNAKCPDKIIYRMENKFPKILKRIWEDTPF